MKDLFDKARSNSDITEVYVGFNEKGYFLSEVSFGRKVTIYSDSIDKVAELLAELMIEKEDKKIDRVEDLL